MKLEKKRIRPFTSPLMSFIGDRIISRGIVTLTGDRIVSRGIVTLTVIAHTYPAQIAKEIDFLIVDYPSTYHIILGRPALNMLRVATSTYYM